jgi:hypothetical protein
MTAPGNFVNVTLFTGGFGETLHNEVAIEIDQGGSFSGTWCWVNNMAGVNPAGSVPTATFRQQPTDAPQLTLTSTPSSFGSVSFGSSFSQAIFFESVQSSVSVTLYPITVAVGIAGAAQLAYPMSRWKLNLLWPDGTATDVVHGPVKVANV